MIGIIQTLDIDIRRHLRRKKMAETDRKLQLVFLLGLVVPLVGIAMQYSNEERTSMFETVKDQFQTNVLSTKHHDQDFFILISILSIPHVYYYFIWVYPDGFYNLCRTYISSTAEPYYILSNTAHAIKTFQLSCFLIWLNKQLDVTLLDFFKQIANEVHPIQLLFGLQLLVIGQILNMSVYQTLGKDGVYYGTRLKRTIPWVHGFPFDTFPHPQYLGATLSIWGVLIIIATPVTVAAGIINIGIVMTIYYRTSSWYEQNL